MYSHNTAENLTHFANFPENLFLVGMKLNICTASFLDSQKHCILKALEKQMPILSCKSL